MSPILCWAGSGTVKEFHVSEDVFHVFKEYLSLQKTHLPCSMCTERDWIEILAEFIFLIVISNWASWALQT